MTAAKRRLYLHIGCRKSGTSSLQAALRKSHDVLARQGVTMPFGDRHGHFSSMVRPLSRVESQSPARTQRALAALASRLEQTEGDRLLLTIEDLAEMDAGQAALLMSSLSGFEVHLVITARDWARQIPSEWQQSVKARLTVPYPDFVHAIRDRTADADVFLARQDVPAMAARWGADLPPGQVHVLAVPPSGSDPSRLSEMFAQVVGIDPATLAEPGSSNPSLGYEQAETLRRVNVALGDRLMDLRSEYRWAVRRFVYYGGLIKQSGTPLRLPPEAAGWCHEATCHQVEEIRAHGYHVVGEVEDLVSSPQPTSADLPEVSEAAVAQAAVAALADVAVLRFDELKQAKRQVAGTPPRVAPPVPATTSESSQPTSVRDRVREALPPPVLRTARTARGLLARRRGGP